MWWGGAMRTSKWPVFRLLNKNVNFYFEAALCEGFLPVSPVQDTWCEPSWFNTRLLLPKDDVKGHFLLEFFFLRFLRRCISEWAALCTRLLDGWIHGPFAVAQRRPLKCICSCDTRWSGAEDGNFSVWHRPAGYIVLSQRSKAAVPSLRNNHILATSTGRLFSNWTFWLTKHSAARLNLKNLVCNNDSVTGFLFFSNSRHTMCIIYWNRWHLVCLVIYLEKEMFSKTICGADILVFFRFHVNCC